MKRDDLTFNYYTENLTENFCKVEQDNSSSNLFLSINVVGPGLNSEIIIQKVGVLSLSDPKPNFSLMCFISTCHFIITLPGISLRHPDSDYWNVFY